MNVQDMHATAGQVCGLMKILSNQTRLLILCQLAGGERSVGDLARLLDVRESAMSQHLALLRHDGLVATRRHGQTIYYALNRSDVKDLMAFLYATYCSAQPACREEELSLS